MSGQSDADDNVAIQKLEQATKGIAALAAHSGATDKRASVRDSDAKKSSSSKRGARSRGSGRGKFGRGYTGKPEDPKVDPCHICNKMGHWAKDCDQHKEPAMEQAEVKSVSCQLVSPTRIYVTANVDGEPIQCLLDSGCERIVIARSLVPNAWYARAITCQWLTRQIFLSLDRISDSPWMPWMDMNSRPMFQYQRP